LPFWNTYVACTLVNVAYAVLFRYADFVTVVGGTELHLGWIVGVGMVGSVLARFALGAAIDQRGPRLIWLASLGIFAVSCFAHLGVTRCDGFDVYLLRFVYCTSLAGIFGASTTFISGRVNIARMAELVGILGTSGFLGMMLGAQLGDLLVGTQAPDRWLVDRMFVAAGLLGLAAVPFAWMATRKCVVPDSHGRCPVLAVLKAYQPGFVLAVGVATGAALSFPQTFLRTYVADLNIPRISVFFTVVALTAVTTRVVNRRLPDRVGLTTMIFVGVALMAVAQLLYLVVRSEWQLVFPGLSYGMGQAILYPMIAAVGTGTFPIRYRGLGITLVLASFDVGQLIGAPTAGGMLHVCEAMGVPGYPTLFTATAAALVLVGAAYWWTLRRQAAPESALGGPVLLRFPRTAAQRRSTLSATPPDRVAAPARPITSRPHAGNSRSTAAGRR
jgi:MFS family permease